MNTRLTGSFIAPRSGTAKQLVVFLHGYGANGDDLLAIGDEWGEALPDAVFAAPNAPEICDSFAGGYQWFPIRAIDRELIEREKPMLTAMPALDAYLDLQLAQWGVANDKLMVVGFSQGAMMAMYAMPRRKKACAGIIGYSGLLVDAAGLGAPGIQKIPVLAIHGQQDTIVPPECLHGVETGFAAAGFDVETIMRPNLAHGIDPFGLTRGVDFCRECFEKTA